MAAEGKGTLVTIVENVRAAGVAFGSRFAPPADIPTALKKLLADLGIADPQNSVSDNLASAAAAWHDLANSLSGVSLDFVDPAQTIAKLSAQAGAIQRDIAKIIQAPQDALAGLGASANAIRAVFPERLLHYIVYEFLTSTHPKIGGAFLLLGVLRREVKSAGGNLAFIDNAGIRVFDLAQLIRAITHPRESFLTVMRWGTNDFLARPIVDGMTLLLGTIPGTTRGPQDDEFPIVDERLFVPDMDATGPSARRTLSVPGGTLSFVGLHKRGIGLEVPIPLQVGGQIPVPPFPAVQIFALTPGALPATDDPRFEILPR